MSQGIHDFWIDEIHIKRPECHANDPTLPCEQLPKFIIGERMDHNWDAYVKRTCAAHAHHVINASVSPVVNVLKLHLLFTLYSQAPRM